MVFDLVLRVPEGQDAAVIGNSEILVDIKNQVHHPADLFQRQLLVKPKLHDGGDLRRQGIHPLRQGTVGGQWIVVAAGIQVLRRRRELPLSLPQHVCTHIDQNAVKPGTHGVCVLQAILLFQCFADSGLYRVQSLFPVVQIAVRQTVEPRLVFHKISCQSCFRDM